MNHKNIFLLSLLILPALLFSQFAHPQPALAQFGVGGVQPTSISNATTSVIIITGSDFVDGATVLLEGYGSLDTTFVSATVLRATVPAGTPPGTYSITVINADGSPATLNNALTVTEVQATSIPSSNHRPLLVVDTYWIDEGVISANSRFTLWIRFINAGQENANNIIVTYSTEDFMPLDTGGVIALGILDPGAKRKMDQTFSTGWGTLGKTVATMNVQVVYSGDDGTSYTENFTLSLPVTAPAAAAATATPTPTPTATPRARPQMVITSYEVDLDSLQPGSIFSLDVEVANVGNADASRLTMILGGGSSSGGPPPSTPDPTIPGGGISGASGDFGVFAPVASSNVQYLGDLKQGGRANTGSRLIVNSSANPGAYPLKISFTYTTADGTVYTDDQVVTMLVYSTPLVDVNFYRPPDPLFAGQMGALPLQVINLGRKASVLGSMVVTSADGMVENGQTLIGTLDTGFPYTFDSMIIPNQPGPVNVQVEIHYTDDFNQPQVITKTLTLEAMEAPVFEPPPEGIPGEGGIPVDPTIGQPETTWQKVVRFLKGLFGLDSGQPQQDPGIMPGDMPPGEMPGGEPAPVPLGKG